MEEGQILQHGMMVLSSLLEVKKICLVVRKSVKSTLNVLVMFAVILRVLVITISELHLILPKIMEKIGIVGQK